MEKKLLMSIMMSFMMTVALISCGGDSDDDDDNDTPQEETTGTSGTTGSTGTSGSTGTTGSTGSSGSSGSTGTTGTSGSSGSTGTSGTTGGGQACLTKNQESNLRALFTKISAVRTFLGSIRIVPNPNGSDAFNGNGLANFLQANPNAWNMISQFTDNRDTIKILASWSFERGCLFTLADQAQIISATTSSMVLRSRTSDGTVVNERLNFSEATSNLDYVKRFTKDGEPDVVQTYDLSGQ